MSRFNRIEIDGMLILVPIRFYRVGGTTRLSGFLLAGATAALLLIGTGPIAFIREYIDVSGPPYS